MSKGTQVSAFMGLHINEYGLEHSRELFGHFVGFKRPSIPHTARLASTLNRFFFSQFVDRVEGGIYHQTYFDDVIPKWKGKRGVTVYDMIYELYPQYYSPNDPTARNKAKAVSQADCVICISECTKKDIINILGVPREKICVVYLGNSLTCNVRTPRMIASPYLLYVGKRGGYKNFRMLLKAFAHTSALRDHFRIICFGGGGCTPEERELISSLKVAERIDFHAGSDELLANLYTFASALVYPSEYEGFGMPPLEAMHYGCPVVVSDASSIPEIVANAGVYFDSSSEEDLAQKIQTVVSDADQRTTFVARGYEREKAFSWDRCAKETLKVYEYIL